MKFKQWLSDQTVKTFKIANSTPTGHLILQIGVGGIVEGEIDNLTDADLRSLLAILKQRYDGQAATT